MKIAHWGLGILLVMPMGIALGQAQPPQDAQAPPPAPTDALAAAARQAREAKKEQAKPARVWNDDTIPKSNDAISVVGQTPSDVVGDNAAAAPAAANASAGAGGSAAAGAGDRRALESAIANAKEKLATIKVDLDLLQRTYTLDSADVSHQAGLYIGRGRRGQAERRAGRDCGEAAGDGRPAEEIDDLNAELAKLPAPTAHPAVTILIRLLSCS